MTSPNTLKAIAAANATAELEADKERSPALAAAYDAQVQLKTAAAALVDALEAESATIAGCADQIAAVKALV